MSEKSRAFSFLCPATITVHNNGNMARHENTLLYFNHGILRYAKNEGWSHLHNFLFFTSGNFVYLADKTICHLLSLFLQTK